MDVCSRSSNPECDTVYSQSWILCYLVFPRKFLCHMGWSPGFLRGPYLSFVCCFRSGGLLGFTLFFLHWSLSLSLFLFGFSPFMEDLPSSVFESSFSYFLAFSDIVFLFSMGSSCSSSYYPSM